MYNNGKKEQKHLYFSLTWKRASSARVFQGKAQGRLKQGGSEREDVYDAKRVHDQ